MNPFLPVVPPHLGALHTPPNPIASPWNVSITKRKSTKKRKRPDDGFGNLGGEKKKTFYYCPGLGCERKYTSEGNLKRHVSYECNKEPSFKCAFESCNQKFVHNHSMRLHLKSAHSMTLDKNGTLRYLSEKEIEVLKNNESKKRKSKKSPKQLQENSIAHDRSAPPTIDFLGKDLASQGSSGIINQAIAALRVQNMAIDNLRSKGSLTSVTSTVTAIPTAGCNTPSYAEQEKIKTITNVLKQKLSPPTAGVLDE